MSEPIYTLHGVHFELDRYRPHARRLAYRYQKGTFVEREEIEQEAMIAAWNALKDFEGDGSSDQFVRYRMRLRVIDYLRSHGPVDRNNHPQNREWVPLDTRDEHGEDTTVATVLSRERLTRAAAAIRSLTPRRREILTRKINGVPNSEIDPSVTHGTINLHLWTARRTVRAALQA